ncbi:MAG: ATP-binding protein [Ignavibacteria bacterium]|jgi:PAS domain S-box-containing protein
MKKYSAILLSLLPLILGGLSLYLLYIQVINKTIEQIQEQQQIYAKQAAGGIESFFDNCKNALKLLSQDESIIKMNKDIKTDLERFYDSYSNEISAVSRIDKDGILTFTIPYNENVIGKDLSYQPHNALIIKEHIPIVSDVFNTVHGYRAIAFTYPVFDNGNYNGCISLLIPFDVIAKKFLENIKIGETGYAYVLSEQGIELYCPIDGHTGGSIYETSKDYPTVLQVVERMLKKESGTREYYYNMVRNKSVERVRKIAVYQPVILENTFWSIAVTISVDEMLKTNEDYVYYFLTTVLITGITFFILVYVYFKEKINSGKKIRQEEEKYKAVTEQTGQMIYEYNVDTGEIKWLGAIEEVVGYSLEEFNNFNIDKWLDNVHPEDRNNLEQILNTSKQNLSKFHAEYRFKNKNGEYFYVEDSGVYTYPDNKPLCLIGAVKDITSRKLAEKNLSEHKAKLEKEVAKRTKELKEINDKLEKDILIRKNTEEELRIAKSAAEHSDKLKSEFLAQMSHEIRTPVNTILSFSSLLKDEIGDKADEDLQLSFRGIANAGQRITRTIDLILNMSEIQTGTYDFIPKQINLTADILKNLIVEYTPLAKEKDLELNLICEDDEMIVKGDSYTIAQMFSNLIDNAMKYTFKGSITVKCRKENNKTVVEVIDTGIGISEKYLPYLFDPFTQEDQGYTRKFEGTGLGLALVRKYCDLNNAEISVESKKEMGSKFTVIFK